MPTPPVIDPATIASLRTLNTDGDDFLREIVGLFRTDVPARLSEFDQGLSAGDRSRCHRAAHGIKGSSSNIGAMRLREAAARLEEQIEDSGIAAVTPLLAVVRAEAEAALRELEALLR